jgi:hypothetical protein
MKQLIAGLCMLALTACGSGYELGNFNYENGGVKVERTDEKGLCVDTGGAGKGKGCVDIKKKEQKDEQKGN